ncbi:hypothetical protein LV89_00933 [Arcicella aurantiaca]|uniref:Uncharacterized protein n=1 Tax=Arcicella aurantiaca TaxID=591202 RepID=A0A316EDH7_9BACT|nr:hypothetical protein [Arcicella aurantiaca]PWK28155.1 hypothetical protein LV89_00933 [Arcicella aurantiaca]
MNKFRNIFVLLISLLLINNGIAKNLSNNFSEKKTVVVNENHHPTTLSTFVDDTFPDEDFDLEEDSDDSDDDDYVHILTTKNVVIFDEHTNTHLYSYSFSNHSVKRFILYCSLKLHC